MITHKLSRVGILWLFLLIPLPTIAQQTITGTFPKLANQKVRLVGFEGFNTYPIDSMQVNGNGIFQLSFGPEDFGMGYLVAEDNKAFILILAANEDLKLEGEALALPQTIVISSGKQNQLFDQYATEHQRREQALNAWDYLSNMYRFDSLFTPRKTTLNSIEQEKQRIQEEDKAFVKNLDTHSYVRWFLPVRKLVSSVSTIAQYRPDEIPFTIATFRNMDYTDWRLYKSGLLREAIENHFWLIENNGLGSDSVSTEMNVSIDFILKNAASHTEKLDEVINYLFKLFEQRSLFNSAEYLALKVLNEATFTINENLAAELESYRSMKIGNIAPDFEFNGDVFTPGYASVQVPRKLSDISTDYTVLIFGSSWCPACPEELMQIVRLYQKWRAQGVEVVFVSLDEDAEPFKKFISPLPFISISDYQKWESSIVKSYHVFATPTIYLLDKNLEIMLRPNSVKQLDSWIDWYLVKENE